MSEKTQGTAEIGRLLAGSFPSTLTEENGIFAVRPSSTSDVSKVVHIAGQCGCPISVSTSGRNEPEGPGISPLIRLSMESMADIGWIDENSMIAEAQAGMSVRSLEIVLGDHGMTGGFVVGPGADPSLVELLSDESLSESSKLYGRVEDACVGAEGVLPSGEVFKIKPTPLRPAGPDILGLLVAGHGSLSIITSLALKIREQPKSRHLVCASFASIEGAISGAAATARSSVRPAAARIYAPGWPETGDDGHGATEHVAVFVLEGEQAVIDAFAVHVREIVRGCGGRELHPGHHLASRFIKIPRMPSGEEIETVSATADWSVAARVHGEVQRQGGESLVASRLSDFFHEGCRISWVLRAVDFGREALLGIAELVRRFGGAVVSHHPGIEQELPPRFFLDGHARRWIGELKKRMDPESLIAGSV